jgi:ABC-type antimicrobial peptide transport system permease subunit
VVIQFTSSVILIIGVTVIHSQVQFINNKNLGYEPENVLAVSTAGFQNKQSLDALINEFSNLPSVVALCRAQGFPGKRLSGKTLYKNAEDKTGIGIQTNKADSDIFNVLKLKFIAGRALSAKPYENDSIAEVVLNKSAVEYLGFKPDEAIGRQATIDNITSTIVGVVNDFHFASLHQPLAPYSFGNATRESKKFILIRFKTADLLQTMKGFESKFKNLTGTAEFDYLFLDEYLKNQYAAELQARNISVLFTVLAVLIACLGLFGLAAFTAEQRAKEVGIRKVLGATVAQVTNLLTKDFITLVIISIIIAIPIAWIAMNNWLQNYAYRIELSWWLFVEAAAVALIIAFVTIGFQTIKAAIANPIKSLRTE